MIQASLANNGAATARLAAPRQSGGPDERRAEAGVKPQTVNGAHAPAREWAAAAEVDAQGAVPAGIGHERLTEQAAGGHMGCVDLKVCSGAAGLD